MKYILKVIGSNGEVNFYETSSRNSKKAVNDYGAYRCIITNKHGKVLSAAEHSDEFGTYNIVFEETIEISKI